MAPTADSSRLSEEIDQLLEHYLELLDQYTTLRSQLSTVQASVYQHISRANFSAERGIRYGPDCYDARMQAARVCSITVPSLDTATTVAGGVQQAQRVVEGQTLDDVERDTTATSTRGGNLKESTTATDARQNPEQSETLKNMKVDTAYFTISTAPSYAQEKEKAEDSSAPGADKSEKTKMAPKDPLRMFGLLTPPSLRLAQTESIKSVEKMVPRLVSIDAEMKEVEIRIRRARKWKAKAEAQEGEAAGNVGERRFERAEQKQEVVV